MLITIRNYFLLFLIYAVMGWCAEVIYALVFKKKLTNRGFMIGPYCPIYGIGCVLMITLLKGFNHHPVAVFFLAILIAGVLEYITSYLMEKLFKARWWDYSKTKYNINGRVCLDTMLPFGVLALAIIYLVNPFVIKVLNSIPSNILTIITIITSIIFITDFVISLGIVNNFKKTIKKASMEDRTDDINTYIRDTLFNRSRYHRRLLTAFPSGHAIIKKVKQEVEEIIKKED